MRKIVLSAGFTLIEMAIVVVVIGLIAGAGLQVAGPIRNAGKAQVTADRMDLIQKALQLYVIRHGCLPCPADGALPSTSANAGQASFGTPYLSGCAAAACITADAVIPWRTLEISPEEAADGWGSRIRYKVSDALAQDNGMVRADVSTFPTGSISIEESYIGCINPPACTTSGLVRASAAGASGSDPTDRDITQAAYGQMAYAIVSSGPDRALAIPANGCPSGCPVSDPHAQQGTNRRQDLNASAATTVALIDTPITAEGVAHFDDIVRYITPALMILKCGANACGNPS